MQKFRWRWQGPHWWTKPFLKNIQDNYLASDTSATTTLLVGLWKNKASSSQQPAAAAAASSQQPAASQQPEQQQPAAAEQQQQPLAAAAAASSRQQPPAAASSSSRQQQQQPPAAAAASSSQQQPAGASSSQPAAAASSRQQQQLLLIPNSPETHIFHFVLAAENAPDRKHRRSNHIEDGCQKNYRTHRRSKSGSAARSSKRAPKSFPTLVLALFWHSIFYVILPKTPFRKPNT